MAEYRKLQNDTVVGFFRGYVNLDGSLHETRLNKQSCLTAIETIKSKRAGYATQAAYDMRLDIYEGAARFMGWLD